MTNRDYDKYLYAYYKDKNAVIVLNKFTMKLVAAFDVDNGECLFIKDHESYKTAFLRRHFFNEHEGSYKLNPTWRDIIAIEGNNRIYYI